MNFKLLNKLISSFKEPTSSVTVEEIHYEFNSAGEKLYQEALKIINNSLLLGKERIKMLKNIGFVNLPEVKDFENKDREIDNNRKVAELITYFRVEYPQYKFITKDKIIEICKKYDLVFGEIKNYIGNVPNKSLKDIDNFNEHFISCIKDEDSQYIKVDSYFSKREEIPHTEYSRYVQPSNDISYVFKNKSFYIVAPEKDFQEDSRLEVKNNEFVRKVVPDPVVFYPVRGGFLIVVAWGPEADDPEIKNEVKN